MLVTTLLFASVTGIVRYFGGHPGGQAAFIRYIIGGVILPLMCHCFQATIQTLDADFVVRGLLHGCGVILWFYAMAASRSLKSRRSAIPRRFS